MPAAKRENLLNRNIDFGEMRLASMDAAGISRAVLGLAGPGVQAEKDAATAVRTAKAGNDFLAKEVQKRPNRYSGFAHLPMQDAKAAADKAAEDAKRVADAAKVEADRKAAADKAAAEKAAADKRVADAKAQ